MYEEDANSPTTMFVPPPEAFRNPDESSVTMESLLKNQMFIAGEIQAMLLTSKITDFQTVKDLTHLSTSLVNAANKTEESLRALSTYRAFFEVVTEFLKRRSDTLGEDLLAELNAVALEMRSGSAFNKVVS